jgi:DNA-binding GntR family transcriptional regulator
MSSDPAALPTDDGPRRGRVQRQASLGSQIAAELRQDIVLGRLRAGSRLSQEKLCGEYGTSRMPVRDALLRLVHEGLVALTPGGHYVVARLTPEDVADAFEIEALAHGRAARRATENATPDDLAELEAMHAQMLEAEHAGDLSLLGSIDWLFHRKINLLARSPKLQAVSRNVSVGIPRAYMTALPEWGARSNAVHGEIVAAMRAREGDRVERLVRRIVEDSGADLVSYIRKNRLLDSPPEVLAPAPSQDP